MGLWPCTDMKLKLQVRRLQRKKMKKDRESWQNPCRIEVLVRSHPSGMVVSEVSELPETHKWPRGENDFDQPSPRVTPNIMGIVPDRKIWGFHKWGIPKMDMCKIQLFNDLGLPPGLRKPMKISQVTHNFTISICQAHHFWHLACRNGVL